MAKKVRGDIPPLVLKSERAAQNVWKRAHDRAVRSYGEGRRAHSAAYSALKRSFTKTEEGDRWIRRKNLPPARGIMQELRSLDEPVATYHRRRSRMICQ